MKQNKLFNLIAAGFVLIIIFSQCTKHKTYKNVTCYLDTVFSVDSSKQTEFSPHLVLKVRFRNNGSDTAILFTGYREGDFWLNSFFKISDSSKSGYLIRSKIMMPQYQYFNNKRTIEVWYNQLFFADRTDQIIILPNETKDLTLFRYYYYGAWSPPSYNKSNTLKKTDRTVLMNYLKNCRIEYNNGFNYDSLRSKYPTFYIIKDIIIKKKIN